MSNCTVSGTSAVITGLKNGTAYSFTVSATNSAGSVTLASGLHSTPTGGLPAATSASFGLTTYPLATITPPSVTSSVGWTFGYNSSGQLATSTQTLDGTSTLGGATSATTTISYGVPILGGGSTGLANLAVPSLWAQTTNVPVYGIAIFPPSHIPGVIPTSSDFPYAAISYLDGQGRLVDTAQFGGGGLTLSNTIGSGWSVSAQEYGQLENGGVFNSQNNVVWSLSADNWVAAMASGSSAATNAASWASLSFYNTTTTNGVPMGAELLDTYGPLHLMATSSSSAVQARAHTHNEYGLDTAGTFGTYTGRQTFSLNLGGGPWQLVTRQLSGYGTTADPTQLTDAGRASDFGSTSLPDQRITTNYWTIPAGSGFGDPKQFGTPYQTVVTTGTSTITRQTLLDTLGNVIEVDQPMSTRIGTTAGVLGSSFDQGATVSTYYGPSAPSPCASRYEFDGLLCQSGPSGSATSPSVGGVVPTKTTVYDWGLSPQVVTESTSASSPSTTTLRTTTTTHDESGRPTSSRITDAVTGDVAVNDSVPLYASGTGLPIGSELVTGDTISGDTLTSAGTVVSTTSTTYDAGGRQASFTDANGATSSFTYNVNSQLAQETEPITGVTGGLSICPVYGGTDVLGQTENRPVRTSQSVVLGTSCSGSNPQTFGAAYDANGSATTLQYR